jgi:hypothetical protein
MPVGFLFLMVTSAKDSRTGKLEFAVDTSHPTIILH